MKLGLEQKKSLSNYSGNLSIAWFAAGIIGPIITKQDLIEMEVIMFISLLFSMVLLYAMLELSKMKKEKKERKTKK